MAQPPRFVPGQRWSSVTEPELGLGLVTVLDGRQLEVHYPARDVTRRYDAGAAPLVRAQLGVGQVVQDEVGRSFRVEAVEERDGLLVYRGGGEQIHETDLDAQLDVVTPENRLRSGQVDAFELFDLRREAMDLRHRILSSPARGFLGGRIKLLDHQLSIARDACERHRVRVLLADEVGLGKTIEALLILHRMLLTGRVERALVMVPRALVHQWLAEAFLRFNLVLRVLGKDTLDSQLYAPESEAEAAMLRSSPLCLCPLDEAPELALDGEDFDLLIVDEAHRLGVDHPAYQLVAHLTTTVPHVLILSATPDQDGEEAHFQRLALLDPVRFHDLAEHRRRGADYAALADAAEKLQSGDPLTEGDRATLRDRCGVDAAELSVIEADPAARRRFLGRLLDLHGLGRVMFRNVRARIPGFPRRVHCPAQLPDAKLRWLRAEFAADVDADAAPAPVPGARDPRCAWLRDLLDTHPGQRVLVLCSNRAKVEAFARALETQTFKVARFQEDMSSIERDRQAAWFLADDGPQLLISSAIGAEGRNFQVARHLVLIDMPATPDRLEQMIGRVDRIGQGEEVFLHTPVAPGSPQEWMVEWYSALGIFTRPWHGSPVIEREFGRRAVAAALDGDRVEMECVIAEGQLRNQEVVRHLEAGRDRLLELTSFDIDAAHALSDAIARAQGDPDLERFMVRQFELAGLKVERIDHRSYAVEAGADYHRPVPGFIGSEMAVTFDRGVGLEHPDRILLTHDHPMVRDGIDDLLANEAGNATVARLFLDGQEGILLEALFVAEPTVERRLRADRFFPPTPVRVVLDGRGREIGVDAAKLAAKLRGVDARPPLDERVAMQLQPLVERARAVAATKAPPLAAAARTRMHAELDPQVERWTELARSRSDPAAVGETSAELARSELAQAEAERAALDTGLQDFRLRLDALRVIYVSPA